MLKAPLAALAGFANLLLETQRGEDAVKTAQETNYKLKHAGRALLCTSSCS